MAKSSIPVFKDDAMSIRLSELTRKYIDDPRYLTTARSKETYERHLGQFLAYLQEQRIENSTSSLTIEHCEGFVSWLFARGASAGTVNLAMSAIAGLCTYGMQNRHNKKPIVESNPIDFIRRPKMVAPPKQYLTLDEMLRLREEADTLPANERVALTVIMDQPLRATEWCEAKVKNLQLDGEELRLNIRVKGGRHVTKTLGRAAAAALLAHLKEREAGSEETLLVNRAGLPYNRTSLSKLLWRTALRAGITRVPVRCHRLRYSAASFAAQNGVSDQEIAAMLNHSDTSTVRKYIGGVRPDAALAGLREALEKRS